MRERFWPYVKIDEQNITISLPCRKRFSFSLEPPAGSGFSQHEWLWFGLLLSARKSQIELKDDDIAIFDVVRKKIVESEVTGVPAMVPRDRTDRE